MSLIIHTGKMYSKILERRIHHIVEYQFYSDSDFASERTEAALMPSSP